MGKINTIIENGGFSRRVPSEDGNAGFVFGGVAASGLALDTVSPVMTSIEEAEALGIDVAYDTTNVVLVHEHLKRFWKRNPGTKVWIMLVAQGTLLSAMADVNNAYMNTLIQETEGKIKIIGLVLNPAAPYAPDVTSGLDDDTATAVAKAQETADAQAEKYRDVLVVIEGKSLTGTAAALTDLRAADQRNVMVTTLSDPILWELNALHESHAAVGDVVGLLSAARVHENIGWPEKFNLQDKANGYFETVGMSDGELAGTREAEFDTLNQKGIAFGRKYPQQDGVYMHDAPSCDVLVSDYAYATETRVVNKAKLLTYNALFPKVNSPVKVDAKTGQIDRETIAAWEALAQRELDAMARDGEISGGEAYIDPAQNVTSTGKVIVKIKIVSIATGRTIEISIGFTKSLN